MAGIATLERLSRAEMDGELAATLDAVGEATVRGQLKYPPRLHGKLARAIACRAYAGPIFELTHLMAAAQCVFGDRGYESLFWDQGPATAERFRQDFERALTNPPGAADHIHSDGTAIHAAYADGAFTLTYARMPFLSAMLDFLVAALGYGAVDDALRDALGPRLSRATLARAANRITRSLYAYLKPRLPTAQAQRKYRSLMAFLLARTKKGTVRPEDLDDDDAFDFWQAESVKADGAGDWKTFRTVFRAFVHLREALRAAADHEALACPLPIDPERDAGGVDPGQVMAACAAFARRKDPLEVLGSAPAKAIKFLNRRETDGISLIMDSGDAALAMPLSLLRAEVFGAVQAGISQCLRRGDDGRAAVARSCDPDDESYCGRVEMLDETLAHMEKALHAAYHVLAKARHGDAIALLLGLNPNMDLRPLAPALAATARVRGNVVALGAQAVRDEFFAQAAIAPAHCPELGAFVARCARAHRRMARKGFTGFDAGDPEIVEGFAAGAGALLRIRDAVARYRARLDRLMPDAGDRDRRYRADRGLFFTQFRILYGGTP